VSEDDDRFECPESVCIQAFDPEGMVAHLQWDHGYSEFKAKQIVERECPGEVTADEL
jgi:hypothetical protein